MMFNIAFIRVQIVGEKTNVPIFLIICGKYFYELFIDYQFYRSLFI